MRLFRLSILACLVSFFLSCASVRPQDSPETTSEPTLTILSIDAIETYGGNSYNTNPFISPSSLTATESDFLVVRVNFATEANAELEILASLATADGSQKELPILTSMGLLDFWAYYENDQSVKTDMRRRRAIDFYALQNNPASIKPGRSSYIFVVPGMRSLPRPSTVTVTAILKGQWEMSVEKQFPVKAKKR